MVEQLCKNCSAATLVGKKKLTCSWRPQQVMSIKSTCPSWCPGFHQIEDLDPGMREADDGWYSPNK